MRANIIQLCVHSTHDMLSRKQGVSRRQSPGEIAAAATSHSLPSLGGSTHALVGDALVAPMDWCHPPSSR